MSIDIGAWGWPQLIYLALLVLGAGMELARHGQPKTGEHNVITTLIASAIILALLAWGGFFR